MRQLALKRAASLLLPSPKTTPDVWGSDNRVYPLSAGRPGRRNPAVTPYAVPFARALSDPRYETVVFVTGTQSGKTDTILDVIGWQLDTRPRPILYVGPSKDFVADQFEPRLMALFDESQRLAARVARGKRNKKTVKIVNGVRVRLGWAGSATSLSSDQAGLVLIDEYSKMFRTSNKAGDPYVLAKARADTYADRKIGVTSTPEDGQAEIEHDAASGLAFWKVMPTDSISCRTWLRWQTGTRHHMAWRCPHCDEWFIPRYRDLRWPEGANSDEARRSTYLCCPSNGCVIDESEKETMNAGAQPVAPGEFVREDGSVGGDPADTTTYSLWASGLMSPFLSWGERVEEILKSRQVGDPSSEKAAVNKLGELWFDAAGSQISDADFDRKVIRGVRLGDVPPEVLRVTLGADVQKNRIVYVVRGWGSLARSWLLDRGEVWGLTNESDVWSRFESVLQKTFAGLRIERVLIDAGFRPDKKEAGDYHKVYDFCRRWRWLCTPTRGHRTQSMPVIMKPLEVSALGKKDVFAVNVGHVDTDYFKSLVHSRLWTPVEQPGSLSIAEDAGDDYRKQLMSEVRSDDGVWTPIYRENHYFDAEVLAAVGGFLLKVHAIPDGMLREDSGLDDADEASVELRRTVAAATAGMSIRERMAARAAKLNQR
jgi:phage terminase large subunit GpA-like protein